MRVRFAKMRLDNALILLTFSLLISSCGGKSEETLKFATVSSDWFNAPFNLALNDQQLLSEIKVRKLDFTSGLASKTAVLGGDVDVGLAALPPLLRDPIARQKIVILACYMSSDLVIGVATKDTANPLAGRIGLIEGTISEIYFKALTDIEQVGEQSSIVGIRPPDGVTLLANGSIDTAIVWEPHLHRAEQLDDVSVTRTSGLYEVNVCAIAARDTYSAKADSIDLFLSSLARASKKISSAPDELRSEVQESLPNNIQIGEVWNDVDFTFVNDRVSIQDKLRRELSALQNAELIEGDINYNGLLEILDAE